MSLIIRHTEAEGTLLLGTSRGDGSAEVIKPSGWRWGRSIAAWFVPRSRDALPRRGLIVETAAALQAAGFEVTVELDAALADRAEVEQRRVDRSRTRVDRLSVRTERERSQADAHDTAAKAITDHIPFGQPILVGHHSQARAERDAARVRRHVEASIDHHDRAEAAAAAARTAAAATGARNNPVTVANRISRLEAQIRREERELQTFDDHVGTPASDRVRLVDRLERARADATYWRQVREQQIAEGTATDYSRETVRPGDLVKIGGRWRLVRRCNAKTVSVETGYSWTGSVPWARIQDHRPTTSGVGDSVGDDQPAQADHLPQHRGDSDDDQ